MKRKRWISVTAAVVLFTALWFLRYRAVNAYYNLLCDTTVTYIDQIGEKVAFGPNRFAPYASSEGYHIRIDGVEFVDYDTYSKTVPLEPKEYPEECDVVALVTVTLFNEDSQEQGVMLTDLMLHTVNQVFYINWDLVIAANPILEGNYGISLPQGTSSQVILPFSMTEWQSGVALIEHPENYDMWLKISSYPVQIEVRVQ